MCSYIEAETRCPSGSSDMGTVDVLEEGRGESSREAGRANRVADLLQWALSKTKLFGPRN
jgi:hypothetical protein